MAPDLFPDSLRPLLGLMLDFHFEEQVRSAHSVAGSPDFYTRGMACPLCGAGRPRRACPGVNHDICAPCCGAERENSIACPLDCEYLKAARKHDRLPELEVEPNHPDVTITEEFLERNGELLAALGSTIPAAAFRTPGAVDRDAREAIDALIRTCRTLESGLYYETRPENPLAAAICDAVKQAIPAFREDEKRRMGVARTRDTDILGVLTHLGDLALAFDNGRPRGRAFLHLLWDFYASTEAAEPPPTPPSLIVS
jgi:hypothetical protein